MKYRRPWSCLRSRARRSSGHKCAKEMNSSSGSSQASAALGQAHALLSHNYTLRSDLAKLCLPSATRDENRKLAWLNSICCLFLVVGAIGLKTRPIAPKQLEALVDTVPVEFNPPAEPPKVDPEPTIQEPDPNQEITVDTPQIATVVAADPSAVNFPMPVDGPVVFAPARFAAPPPPSPPKPPSPPRPTVFNAGKSQGHFPDPPYPSLALRRNYEGNLMLYVIVDTNGSPASITVKDGSGYPLLDSHSSDWVKNHWRWSPGETRHYLVPFHYRIR